MGQHDPELALQAPDVAAQRGLRDAQADGGATEVQLGGEHLERAQVAQLHHRRVSLPMQILHRKQSRARH